MFSVSQWKCKRIIFFGSHRPPSNLGLCRDAQYQFPSLIESVSGMPAKRIEDRRVLGLLRRYLDAAILKGRR
jgi:hypothetical protein